MVAFCLGSCSGQARHAQGPAARATPTLAEPVIHLRLHIIRDWASVYYVIEDEDYDFTLAQAEAFGLPARLWAYFAGMDPTYRYGLYWVRAIKC